MTAAGTLWRDVPRRVARPPALAGLRRRPAFGWEVAVVAAWAVLAVLAVLQLVGSAPHHGGHGHAGTTVATVRLAGAGAAWLAAWGLMCMAMMLPAAIPAVRHVAVKSFRWRRRRAMAEFVAVYLGVWLVFGAVVLALLSWWAPARPAVLLAAVLAVAAAWQLTASKRWAIVACHRSVPLPPRGWRATAGVARFGLRYGGACIASCWAIMLAMAVVPGAHLVWMAALTGIVSAEKLSKRPRRASRCGAALLGTAAVGAGLAAALGG